MKLSSIKSALVAAVSVVVLSAIQAVHAIDTYDVVIIGSGPGGLVAAEFLSRDPSIKVLVLEAGGPSLQASGGTDGPAYAASKGYTKFDIPGEYDGSGSIFNAQNAKYRIDWMSDEPSFLGKLVGGCSSINAALYFRAPDSYVVNSKWPFSPASMNAGYEAIEQMVGHTDSPSPDGKRYLQEAYDIVAKAFKEQGQYNEVTINDEGARNNKDKTFGHAPFAFKNGLRDSPAKVFYGAFKNRPNAKLITYATASYIKHFRGRATGVVYNGNTEVAVSARGAVIMAAGAMSTPKVLIQSGIGPKDQLEMLRRRSDFPGVLQSNATGGWVYNENVGKNLFDTNPVFLSFSHPQMNAVVNKQGQKWATDQYMVDQSGVLSIPGPVLIGYENYKVNGRDYEFQTTINANGFGDFASNPKAFFAALYVNNPESRDYSSFNADGKWVGFMKKTIILSTATDVAAIKSYTRKVVDMLQRSGATFLSANNGESTDAWVDRNKNWKTNHFGGSCYTSSDANDANRCADDKLRVVGTSNIFVSDASLQRDGTVNPYGFIMYTGHEVGNVVKDFVSQSPVTQPQCSASTLEKDVGYVGLDIGSALSSKPEGCCSLCQNLNGCQAFTWTNYNGGTCWLKSAKGATTGGSGSYSGVVPTTPPTTVCPNIQENVDFAGDDVGSALSSTAEGCCSLCQANKDCNVFTWTDYNSGTCWLKSGKGSVTTKAGSRSAVVKETASAPATCPSIEEGVDYIGLDIGSVLAAPAEKCCAICKQTQGCNAYSWSDYNTGTCWLKSGKGATTLKAGARSGETKAGCSTIQANTDLNGTDAGSALASTAEQCCSLCRSRNNCKAYTWTNYNQGTCWFKSSAGTGVAKTGAQSAVVN